MGSLKGYKSQNKTVYHFCSKNQKIHQFDKLVGWREIPKANYFERRSIQDGWRKHTVNELGFRDSFDSGKGFALVLGDSFTRGTIVHDEETYPYLLDKWNENRAFTVLAAQGYGTTQQLLLYNNYKYKVPHSLVILGYYMGNDVEDNSDFENFRRPMVDISGDGRIVVKRKPARERIVNPELELPLNKSIIGKIDEIIQPFQDWLWDNTEIYSLFTVRLKILFGLMPPLDTPEPFYQGLPLTERILVAFARVTNEMNARLLILLIPESGEVNPEKVTQLPRKIGLPFWNSQRKMVSRIEEHFQHVDVLDLKPKFLESFNKGTDPYGISDTHMNEIGHKIAANSVNEYINDMFVSSSKFTAISKMDNVKLKLEESNLSQHCEVFSKNKVDILDK